MTGAVWAAVAGVGFGLFQTLNRQAVRGMDVYVSTFLQLFLSMVVLVGAAVATEDVGLVAAAPVASLAAFALGGFIHFFLGWTLLNMSQQRIGAARTSILIGATPLFGAAIAAVTLDELPRPLALAGVALTVVGVYLISSGRGRLRQVLASEAGSTSAAAWRGSGAGLATALCWAVSPVFIRIGLRDLPSPLLGVTVSMIACVLAYGVALLVRHRRAGPHRAEPGTLGYKLVAGFLVGLSTWARWVALSLTPVAVVLSLGQLSIPTVLLLAPVIAGRHVEQVTVWVVIGAALIIGGSLILITTAA